MYTFPALRCNSCGSELVPRSRLPRSIRRLACQNQRCLRFDVAIDPDHYQAEAARWRDRMDDEDAVRGDL